MRKLQEKPKVVARKIAKAFAYDWMVERRAIQVPTAACDGTMWLEMLTHYITDAICTGGRNVLAERSPEMMRW